MSWWSITHPRPLPHEIEAREANRKTYWKESERLEKEIARNDTCFQCGGKGAVEKCDYELLDQEVRDGQIMESEKYAILKELGRLLPSSTFEPNE